MCYLKIMNDALTRHKVIKPEL